MLYILSKFTPVIFGVLLIGGIFYVLHDERQQNKILKLEIVASEQKNGILQDALDSAKTTLQDVQQQQKRNATIIAAMLASQTQTTNMANEITLTIPHEKTGVAAPVLVSTFQQLKKMQDASQ